MAVTTAYTDPTSGGRSFIPVSTLATKAFQFSEGRIGVFRLGGSTGFMLRQTAMVGGGGRSQLPEPLPQKLTQFKVAMRGSVILSTFPPVYKTALEAEAGKVKTPRVFPRIYIGQTR